MHGTMRDSRQSNGELVWFIAALLVICVGAVLPKAWQPLAPKDGEIAKPVLASAIKIDPIDLSPKPINVVINAAQRTEFEATGYAIGPPYSSITKSGHPVFNKGSISIGDMDVFTIAVDPAVIPLGSIVYIDALGMAMATDTGTKIKGMLIDICFSDMNEAMEWGRRKVQVTMLRRGNG